MNLQDFLDSLQESEEPCVVAYASGKDEPLEFKPKQEFVKQFRDVYIPTEEEKALKAKMEEGSNQSSSELNGSIRSFGQSLFGRIATMPYDPYCLAHILEVNPVHFRACEVKSRDSVCRDYNIKPKYPIRKEGTDAEDPHGNYVLKEEFERDCKLINDFISGCNKQKSFQELCYLAAMDRESVGWGAFEVIRRRDGKVARLERIPAVRLRVLEDWEGFVEITTNSGMLNSQGYTYYQPFGEKIKAKEDDFLDISETPRQIHVDYDPEKHGELNVFENNKLTWNLKSKKTGEVIATTPDNFEKEAANEIIFLPKGHPKTVYYGISDILSATNAVEAVVSINRYRDEFFENNCVPRWAIMIKGARISPEFQKEIEKYFEKNVRGKNGKTLIMALSTLGNKNIDVTFQRLDAEQKEADFIETKKSYYQDVMISHGVSPSLLTIHETASLGSGRGQAQSEQYKDRFVVPSQLYWATKLNELFRLGLGATKACIEFDPLDVKDELQTAQVLNLLTSTGIFAPNESREKVGLEPIDGGDKPFVRSGSDKITLIEQLAQGFPDLTDQEMTLLEQIQMQNQQLSGREDPTETEI